MVERRWGVVQQRCLPGTCRRLCGEGGVDAAEVGFAVADAEGEIVDVGDARARVGVSTL